MEYKSADPAYGTSEIALFARCTPASHDGGDLLILWNHISRDELTGGDPTNIDCDYSTRFVSVLSAMLLGL